MSLEIVAQAKADLIAAGYRFDHPDQQARNDAAFLIVMEAASRIRGAGVLAKSGGNHAVFQGESYAVDIIIAEGLIVDCLIDGGNTNTPVWQEHTEPVDPSRIRPAVAILAPSVPPPVVPPEVPGIPTPTLAYILTRIDDLEDATGRIEGLLSDLRIQSDANTEKIQQQIDQVVKNAEASVQAALPQILGALGGGGILGGLFGRTAPRKKAKP